MRYYLLRFLFNFAVMDIRKKIFHYTKQDYYTMHLFIINPFLPIKLSPKEIEVLACFMSLTGDVTEEGQFSKGARRIVRNRLNLSHGGLGNYLKSIETKGFIRFDEMGIGYIPTILIPDKELQGYNFEIELKED